MPQTHTAVQRAQSTATDPEAAVREVAEAFDGSECALVLAFVAPTYDRERLAAAFAEHLPGVPVVGCTTAGEFGPAGYREGSLAAAAFSKEHFRFAVRVLDDLQHFEVSRGVETAQSASRELAAAQGFESGPGESFALLLVDGLSMREEVVLSALAVGLVGVPLIGGSAGDGLALQSTWVLADGTFHGDSAVLAVGRTDVPFEVFHTHHLEQTVEALVVTAADVGRRLVHELNGLPAAEELARVAGVHRDELTPEVLSRNSFVVRLGGEEHVRAIQRVDESGSLWFYCAIDEGLVLRHARTGDMVGELQAALARTEEALGGIELVLGCDCILRFLEARSSGLVPRLEELFARYGFVGFSTYGEQIGPLHVSQTMTGLAFGKPAA